MCGIAGAYVFEGSDFRVTEPYLAVMRDTMVHRGPDGDGAWIHENGRVGFAHRRLAIIDLSEAANQPMSNRDGSIRIVFNGEIYNHAEIRSELESEGHDSWKTSHSDTEVIIRAYEQWGIDCVHRFRGMFAFALWDNRSRDLWLVRDRLGIKPLYYSVHHGRLVFASEIKALLKDPGQSRAVDEEALSHYLSFLTTPAPLTLFQGIAKLPPATRMRFGPDGSVREERYWDVWDHVQPNTGRSEDDMAAMLLAELRESVRLRKVSDVPVGVFLSGGVDSSTNAALFAEGEDAAVKTFSIGYGEDCSSNPSELPYARRAAEFVGAENYERVLGIEDLLDFLPEMIRLQDEPIADPVCVPVYYVSKLARDHGVTVCQVGEGADELFWGYRYWKRALRMQELLDRPIPSALLRAAGLGLRLAGKGRSDYANLLKRRLNGDVLFWGGAEAFLEWEKTELLSERLRRDFTGRSSWDVLQPVYRRFRDKAAEPSWLNWMTYLDLNLRLPELLLMRVDKMSMGVSLETRVPFLDHKFVELAMSIPQRAKTRNGTLKHILKKAVHGVIPDDIIHRRKQGFGVPTREWFLDELGKRARKSIGDLCTQTDFFDQGAVTRLFEQSRGDQVWYLMNFALWWQEHMN